LALPSQVENRRNIRVPNLSCGSGLAHETATSGLLAHHLSIDNLQRDNAPQIDIERFVRDPHAAPTKLNRCTIWIQQNSIVLETVIRLAATGA
jgi:hypothetical protein